MGITLGKKQYASNGGTSKPAGHLRNHDPRKLRESSHPGTVPVVGTSPLTAAVAQIASSREASFTKDSADRLLLNWIVYSNQPFTLIEDDSFQELIKHIQPKYKLAKSANTIRSWVIRNYDDQKQEVRLETKNAIKQIQMSIDWRTSPHTSMYVIGIVSHFTSQRGNRMNPLLAVREIEGSHTGNALAEIVVKGITE